MDHHHPPESFILRLEGAEFSKVVEKLELGPFTHVMISTIHMQVITCVGGPDSKSSVTSEISSREKDSGPPSRVF